ncbi:MAG TPA: hypothetical protein VIL13_10155 [Longimicrobiales bacterium]
MRSLRDSVGLPRELKPLEPKRPPSVGVLIALLILVLVLIWYLGRLG